MGSEWERPGVAGFAFSWYQLYRVHVLTANHLSCALSVHLFHLLFLVFGYLYVPQIYYFVSEYDLLPFLRLGLIVWSRLVSDSKSS